MNLRILGEPHPVQFCGEMKQREMRKTPTQKVLIATALFAMTIPVAGTSFEEVPVSYTILATAAPLICGMAFLFAMRSIRKHEQDNRFQVYSTIQSKLVNDGQPFDTFNVSMLAKYLDNATLYIKRIGNGELTGDYPGLTADQLQLNNGNLVDAIIDMKSKLTEVAEAERQRSWISQGIAEFSEILRDQGRDFSETLDLFIARLVRYINANQAGIFISKVNDGGVVLELQACYAYSRKKFVKKVIEPGEGLVGQAFQEGEMIFLTDVPENYIRITSGLGEALPRCVVLIPLKYNDQVLGVMEIASFDVWARHHLEFLNDIAGILGSAVSYMRSTDETRMLLEASQQQAAQLKLQEEELKKNLEMLNATQEAVERKSKEALEQNIKLNAVLDSTADTIVTVDDSGVVETINMAGLKLTDFPETEIIGKPFTRLFDESNRLGWETLQTGLGSIHKAKIKTREGETVPVELSVNKSLIGGTPLFTAVITNVSERLKAEQDQLQYIEELRAQEEELRQNMEELSATQEEIERQFREINKINGELDARVAALNVSTIMSEADLYGTILFVNDKFVEVSQYAREELVGKPHNVVRHPDMPAEVFKQMWATIKSGKVFRGIVKNRRKDGTHYWVDAVISPVLNEAGVPVKYIGVRYVIEDEEWAQKLFDIQTGKSARNHVDLNSYPALNHRR